MAGRRCPRHDEPVRFVQMWVTPDERSVRPGCEQRDIDDATLSGGLVPVASGMDRHSEEAWRAASWSSKAPAR